MRHQQMQPPAGKKLSILVVGEAEILLQAMKCWLAPLGHQLTWVPNGLDAIRQLRLRHFDMVFTELALPGLDGSLIAQYLKNTNDPATIIGLSSGWYGDRACDLVTDSPAELRYFLDAAAYARA